MAGDLFEFPKETEIPGAGRSEGGDKIESGPVLNRDMENISWLFGMWIR
jgi:hypothetical protein